MCDHVCALTAPCQCLAVLLQFCFSLLGCYVQQLKKQISHSKACTLDIGHCTTCNVQVSRPIVTLMLQINNGVYKSGFSTSQEAYDRAQRELYTALAAVEQRLSQHRFLVGDK